MKNKHLAIMVVAVVLLVALAASSYFLLPSQPQYKNITMNGIAMEVPDGNGSVIQQTDFFSIYNDTENGVAIMVYDSANAGLSDLAEAVTFASVRDVFQANSTQQTDGNLTYNYSQSNEIYTYVGNYSHKNLFIATKNKEDMVHILQSINVEVDLSLNETNQTNVSVTTRTTTESSSDNESADYEDEEYVDDRDYYEYEASREEIDSGYERDYSYDEYYSG